MFDNNLRFETRGNRTYAFRRGSKGHRNIPSRTECEYLGVVDPDTNAIIPARKRDGTIPSMFDSISALDLGNVLILHSIACDLNIPDDLESVFGSDAPWILLLAMAQAIRSSSLEESLDTLSGTFAYGLMGVNPPISSRIPIRCEVKTEEMALFYNRRQSRGQGFGLVALHIGNDVSNYSRKDVVYIAPDGSSGNNVLISVDGMGIPTGMSILHGSHTNTGMIVHIIRDLCNDNPGCTLTLDRAFVDSGRLHDFLGLGADVVASSKVIPSSIGDTLDKLDDGQCHDVTIDGRKFDVVDTIVGTLRIGNHVEYLGENDSRIQMCDNLLFVGITRDVSVWKRERSAIKSRLSEVCSELNGIRSDDPLTDFHAVAREAMPFLNMNIRKDGSMRVTVKRDEVNHLISRAGVFVIISTGVGFNEALTHIRHQNELVSDLGPPFNLLDDVGFKGYKSAAYRFGRLVRVISAMLLTQMRRVLEDNGFEIEPRDALRMASKYRLIRIAGDDCVTDPDAATESILRIFGIGP